MTHIVVLAIAAAMSGYAIDRNFFPNFHAAAASEAGVAVGDVSLGHDSVIVRPLAIPTSPLLSRAPIVHIVGGGDTLESIGRQYNLSWREVLWSNPGLRMPLTVGRPIKLPPVRGVVVLVRNGDTPTSLATKYGVEETTLLGFNGLRGPQLTPGSVLVIPVDPAQGPNLSTGLPADPVYPGRFLCPIAGAKISAGAVSTTTNAAGTFSFVVPGGITTLTASAPGYSSSNAYVNVTPGSSLTYQPSLLKIRK